LYSVKGKNNSVVGYFHGAQFGQFKFCRLCYTTDILFGLPVLLNF